MATRTVNDHGLEEAILEVKGFVVVAFTCPDIPCRHFAPEFEAAAETLEARALFVRIDAQENPTIAEDLAIEAIPTTLVFKDGDEAARYEGPYSKESLVERLKAVFAPDKKGRR